LSYGGLKHVHVSKKGVRLTDRRYTTVILLLIVVTTSTNKSSASLLQWPVLWFLINHYKAVHVLGISPRLVFV